MNERFKHLTRGHRPLLFSQHLCLWAPMRGYILPILALASRQQRVKLVRFIRDPHQLYLALPGVARRPDLAGLCHGKRPAALLYHWLWRARPLALPWLGGR